MQSKVALVGCRHGHWIRTADMRSLRVHARVQSDVTLGIYQCETAGDERAKAVVGPGTHPVDPASWTRVCVLDGPHIDALVILKGD